MASSSGNSDSLVTLRFHDFRVERMRHWSIMACSRLFASFWDPTHCCFSIGEVDLVPTLEEYAGLLQLGSPFSETPVIPIQSPRSNRVLEKYLGLTSAVLHSEIIRPEETWRKANISLDLLAKYFSWSDFPVEFARDFIAGKKGWKKFRINAFKIAFAGIFLFPTSAGRIDLGVIPPIYHLQHFYRLQTPYHFERYTVRQTVKIALPFAGNSRDWALYLLDLPLSEWSWKVTWGPAAWAPWTHCALFDGVPLPGVWGCTGYYPSLALRQFGGVQYPPRLGDLSAVTFDYIPGEDMWRLLFRIEDIWRRTPFRNGPHRGWCIIFFGVSLSSGFQLPLVSLRGLLFWRESLRRLGRSCHHYALPGRLRERSLRLVWSPCGVPCITTVWRWRIFAVTWRFREGMSPTLRTMNDFIREQLEISEAAKDHMEETLTETQGQLETEQVERTRVQDELDSLRSYTQALVDPSTGRPHDIVALRRALDESEAALNICTYFHGGHGSPDQRSSG
uniref:Aminotransferase-like plant mobile domain-containing protein n=1 Tax=Fagus sylvatica TaxID=28930 RepID=A0A2N9ISA0_FAGSY